MHFFPGLASLYFLEESLLYQQPNFVLAYFAPGKDGGQLHKLLGRPVPIILEEFANFVVDHVPGALFKVFVDDEVEKLEVIDIVLLNNGVFAAVGEESLEPPDGHPPEIY